MFNFKKKKTGPQYNDYDLTLKSMLDSQPNLIKELRSYAAKVYFKQKSLSVYPEGEEYNLALNRIKSNQICLQYAIEEYDEWYARVTQYIDENMDKFEYYHGYQTGDRNYPMMSYEIIDNTIRFECMRDGLHFIR